MNDLLLSIIIPSFNYAQHIEKCLASIPQDKSIEVLVINDGSTDHTEKVVKKFISGKKNFFYFLKKNGGSSSARNYGIKKAKGKFIIFLDADDIINDKSISNLIKCIKKNRFSQNDLIVSDHFAKNTISKKVKKIKSDFRDPGNKYLLLKEYLITKKLKMVSGAIVFPNSFFKSIYFPENFKASEDIPVYTFALFSLRPVKFELPLMTYNHHENSLRHFLALQPKNINSYVDECFKKIIKLSSGKLLKQIINLKKEFYIQRKLSLSRNFYIAGKYEESIEYYISAFKESFFTIFKFSYFRKFIYSYLHLIRLRYFTILKYESKFVYRLNTLNFDQVFRLEGNLIRKIQNRQVLHISNHSTTFFIKKFDTPQLREIFKSFLNFKYPIVSAINEFEALRYLKNNNIRTIKPLCFGSSGIILKKSFLITEPLNNMIQLDHYLKRASFSTSKKCLLEVCKIIKQIQELGLIHRDLYLCHFWIPSEKNKDRIKNIHIIDLHRAVIKNKISIKERLKEIADFIFSVELLDPKLKNIVQEYFQNEINKDAAFVNDRVSYLLEKYKKKYG